MGGEFWPCPSKARTFSGNDIVINTDEEEIREKDG